MAQNKKKPSVTPAGRAIFPRLNEPDTKFNEDGVYTVTLALEGEEAQAMIEVIEEAKKEAMAMAKKQIKGKKKPKEADLPYFEVLDENEEETGEIGFKFKMKASGVSKKTGKRWERRPALFDAKTKRINADTTQIWGGSIIKVSYTADPYYVPALGAGVSLRLEGVQVIELVTAGGKSASDLGFGEEDGYEGAEETGGFEEEDGYESDEAQEGEEDF